MTPYLQRWANGISLPGMLLTIAITIATTYVVFNLLAPAVSIDTQPVTEEKADVVVQTLDVEPEFATAEEICLSPDAKVYDNRAGTVQNYSIELTENVGDLNQVRYDLTWIEGGALIAVEEARAGTAPVLRTDPMTARFLQCVKDKDVVVRVNRQ